MSSGNRKQTKSCHGGDAGASDATQVKPGNGSFAKGIFVKKFYKNKPSKVDQAVSQLTKKMEEAFQSLNYNMKLIGGTIQEMSTRPTLKECSTQTQYEGGEEKVSSIQEEHNRFFIKLIDKFMKVCVCKCVVQTQCKGTTAMRLFVNKHVPGHTNPFFKFVDHEGNPISDIDLNMCNTNFNNLMRYVSTLTSSIRMEKRSSFRADSEIMRLQSILKIYTYKIYLKPSNMNCSALGLVKPMEIILDISIKTDVSIMQYLSATHRAVLTTKNTYGFNEIVMHDIDFFSIRGLIEYAKSEIHKDKVHGNGLQIIEPEKCPLRILRAINEEDEYILRTELLEGRSYQLLRFCKEYHKLSNDTALMNNDGYLDKLYSIWKRNTQLNNDEVSCPKDKGPWKEWIRSQMEGMDVYTCDSITESRRVVVLPCSHIVGYIGYLNQLIGYLIYRMNRLEGQPPSFVEDLNHNVDCPICRKESFVIGTIRSDMAVHTRLGKDVMLNCSDPRFIRPLSC